MVTAKTQYNLANAQTYFSEHLAVGDYYQEGQRVAGDWFGISATSLGLGGKVAEAEFPALCENQHPRTGEGLIARKKARKYVEAVYYHELAKDLRRLLG